MTYKEIAHLDENMLCKKRTSFFLMLENVVNLPDREKVFLDLVFFLVSTFFYVWPIQYNLASSPSTILPTLHPADFSLKTTIGIL